MVVLIVFIGVVATSGDHEPRMGTTPTTDVGGASDPTGEADQQDDELPDELDPSLIEGLFIDNLRVGDDMVWVADRYCQALVEVDVAGEGGDLEQAILPTAAVAGVEVVLGTIWLATGTEAGIVIFDPATGAEIDRIGFDGTVRTLVSDDRMVVGFDGVRVYRFDAVERELIDTYVVGADAHHLAIEGDSIWLTNWADNTVSHLRADAYTPPTTVPSTTNPSTTEVPATSVPGATGAPTPPTAATTPTTVDTAAPPPTTAAAPTTVGSALRDAPDDQSVEVVGVGDGPFHVATLDGDAWVTNIDDGTVSRISGSYDEVTATIEVGPSPHAIAAAAGSIWVGTEGGQLWRIDPADNRAELVIASTVSAIDMDVAGDDVWISDSFGAAVARFDADTETLGQLVDLSDLTCADLVDR